MFSVLQLIDPQFFSLVSLVPIHRNGNFIVGNHLVFHLAVLLMIKRVDIVESAHGYLVGFTGFWFSGQVEFNIWTVLEVGGNVVIAVTGNLWSDMLMHL